MHPGYIIKLLRTAERMQQAKLAEKIDVSNSYLSLIESGKKVPTIAVLKKVSEIFHVPVALLFIEDEHEDNDILESLQEILTKVISAKIAGNKQ